MKIIVDYDLCEANASAWTAARRCFASKRTTR